MYSHLVCSYIGSCKNLIVKYKVKRKRKRQGNVLILVIWFVKWCCFSHLLSIGLVLNRRTLAATALYETYNIPIVKKYNRFIIFLEHKLYGFLQNERTTWSKHILIDSHYVQVMNIPIAMNKTLSLRTYFDVTGKHLCA